MIGVRVRALAWTLGGFGVACVLAAAGFFAAGGHRVAVLYGNEVGVALGFTVVGAVVAARVPANPLGWLLLVTGVVHASGLLALEYLSWLGPRVAQAPVALVTYSEVSWLPGFVTLFTLVPLLFPTGAPPGRRWRVLLWSILVGGVTAASSVLTGTERWSDFQVANPLYHPAVADVLVLALPVLVASAFGSVASVVVRYRRSTGVQRQQMRWFVWASVVAVVVLAPVLTLNRHNALTVTLQFLVVLAIPVAIGVAILRYRLYDIDRVVSRTVSYALVTGLLVGVYVGCVALTTGLLPFSSSFGVAASTLVAAALFQPLRRRVQSAVDRRFNRQRYDAARTVDEFSRRLRDEVDLVVVRDRLLSAVDRTVQPVTASVWLGPAAVSTSSTDSSRRAAS